MYFHSIFQSASCSIQAAIRPNGLIALHHDADVSQFEGIQTQTTNPMVDVDETINYWSVHWARNSTGDEQFPSIDNNCGNGACILLDDDSCFCSATVIETPVFSSLPTREEILAELKIGAFELDMFDENQFQLVETGPGVEVYRKAVPGWQTPPTASPTGRCVRNLINWDYDFEAINLKTWRGYGNAYQLEEPGYNSEYAIRGNTTNWNQGVYQNEYMPLECLSPGVTISISFKVKMERDDETDVTCNPYSKYHNGDTEDG